MSDYNPELEENKRTELSTPRRRNWQLHRREQKNTYALALFNLGNVEPNAAGNPEAEKIREFAFKMNPQQMELEEPAAVTIKPTQNGGQFVEHQGQIYKNITIVGTTGLRPNRTEGSVRSVTIDPETGLPASERTGFDDLIDLRNLFREYYMAKVDPSLASDVVMVWKNGKEGEYYIVEPMNFKTSRDSGSPLTAKYTIQLRTIRRLEKQAIKRIKDSYMSRKAPEKRRHRVNQTIKELADGVSTLNKNLDSAMSSVARVITDVLRPTNDLLTALTSVVNTSKRIIEIPRSALDTLAANLADAINSVSDLVYLTSDAVSGETYIASYAQVASAMRNLRRAVLQIRNEDTLFADQTNRTLEARRRNYIDSVLGERDAGGDPLALSNETVGSGLAQARIGAGDNIRKLAKRLLGNAARWKSLVIVNDLKSPYVSPDGDGVDVLRPGDYVLYPTKKSSRTAVASESVGKLRTVSPIEERLGRDIKISSPTSAGGLTLFDVVVDGNGDIAMVDGTDNMVQAVRIKFETEQGELALHPFFGIKFPLGVKASGASSFIEFDVNARGTLLSDQRIDSISQLDIEFVGNTLEVRGGVVVKGFDSGLSFDFSTKR